MKINSIFALSLQLLGIYALIISLPYVGGLLSSLGMSGGWEVQKYLFFGELIAFVLLLLTGGFLINLGNKIAKDPELSDKESISPDSQIHSTNLAELSFAIFGLFIIINNVIPSLQRFFVDLYGLIAASQNNYYRPQYLATIMSAITIIIKAAFGIWLFLGSKGFVRFWQKLRQRWNYERNMDKK
jgi:hypothetical protein